MSFATTHVMIVLTMLLQSTPGFASEVCDDRLLWAYDPTDPTSNQDALSDACPQSGVGFHSCEHGTFKGHLLVDKGGFSAIQKMLAAGFGPLAPAMPEGAWSRWVPVPTADSNSGPALGRLELVGAGHEWCNQVFSERISHHAQRAAAVNNWPGGGKTARLRCTTSEPTEIWLAGCNLNDCETTNALQSLNDYFGLATPTTSSWELCIANTTTTTTTAAAAAATTTTTAVSVTPPDSGTIRGGVMCPRADIVLDYAAAPLPSLPPASSSSPPTSLWQTAHAIFGPRDFSPLELLGATGDNNPTSVPGNSSSSSRSSGQLAPVLASPLDGCSPIAAVPKGSLVVLARGACPFALKSKHAAAAGAAVAIIYNPEDRHPYTGEAMGCTSSAAIGLDCSTVTLPTLLVEWNAGGSFLAELAAAPAAPAAPLRLACAQKVGAQLACETHGVATEEACLAIGCCSFENDRCVSAKTPPTSPCVDTTTATATSTARSATTTTTMPSTSTATMPTSTSSATTTATTTAASTTTTTTITITSTTATITATTTTTTIASTTATITVTTTETTPTPPTTSSLPSEATPFATSGSVSTPMLIIPAGSDPITPMPADVARTSVAAAVADATTLTTDTAVSPEVNMPIEDAVGTATFEISGGGPAVSVAGGASMGTHQAGPSPAIVGGVVGGVVVLVCAAVVMAMAKTDACYSPSESGGALAFSSAGAHQASYTNPALVSAGNFPRQLAAPNNHDHHEDGRTVANPSYVHIGVDDAGTIGQGPILGI